MRTRFPELVQFKAPDVPLCRGDGRAREHTSVSEFLRRCVFARLPTLDASRRDAEGVVQAGPAKLDFRNKTMMRPTKRTILDQIGGPYEDAPVTSDGSAVKA
jgi:hypothetical protein